MLAAIRVISRCGGVSHAKARMGGLSQMNCPKPSLTKRNGIQNGIASIHTISFVPKSDVGVINKQASTNIINMNIKSAYQRRNFASLPAHTKVGLPALSPSMEKGNLAKWKKKIGEKLKPGDIIAEVETDKATVEFEVTDSGYLAAILVPEGSKDLPLGTPIAVVVEKESDVAAFKNYKLDSSSASQEAPKAQAPPQPTQTQAPPPAPKPQAPATNFPPHTKVGLPALSPSMEKGNLAKWRKKEGDKVKAGDIIAEIETDKATVEFEFTDNGYLAKILVPEGTKDVALGDTIAIVVEKESDVAAFKNFSLHAAQSAPAPSSAPAQAQSAPSYSTQAPSQPQLNVVPGAPPPPSSQTPKSGVFASPFAKATATQMGVDITALKGMGSGPSGRILQADVVEAKSSLATQKPRAVESQPLPKTAQPSTTTYAASQVGDLFTDIPHTQIRKVIAQRLTQSKQQIPHYYLTVDCRVDNLLQLRTRLNDAAKGEFKLSVNDFVVKAAALALKKVPTCNSSWRDDAVRRFHTVDINVAVNTDRGLLTPLVRDADKVGLASINGTIKEMAEKAKANKISPNDLTIGTFTISNLGMFGIKEFSAVINPPQACILAVAGTEKRVIVDEKPSDPKNPFAVANIMAVTLSCDHRVVDGAVGAEWLKAFKEYLEDPVKMLL